jgi:hypothetical protein
MSVPRIVEIHVHLNSCIRVVLELSCLALEFRLRVGRGKELRTPMEAAIGKVGGEDVMAWVPC